MKEKIFISGVAGFLGSHLAEAFIREGRPLEVYLANCSANKVRELLSYNFKVKLREGLYSIIDYIKNRGVKPFKYHVDLEIINENTPKTWKNKIF